MPLAVEAAAPHASHSLSLGEALARVIRLPLTERETEALAAFVFAMCHHWPTTWRATVGDSAEELEAWAAQQDVSADRLLKLRRLAIARIAAAMV